jgi:5-methylcytosine-specific restriction endonuclease McrA
MAANILELPAKVFVIGSPHGENNVTLHNGVWDANFLFTFIWKTKSDLESWLCEHPSIAHYFEIDVFGVFGCLLFKQEIKYVLANPPADLSHHLNNRFYLRSHDLDAKIDMHSTVDILTALNANLVRTGVTNDEVEAVRAQAQSDPQLSPLDALLKFNPFRESEAVLSQCSGSAVRQHRLEENVWRVLGGSLSRSLIGPFSAIWATRPDLTFKEIRDYWNIAYAAALDRRIVDLNANGEFPLVFDYFLATTGYVVPSLAQLASVASECHEWTFRQVAQRIHDAVLNVRSRDNSASQQHICNAILAWFQLYPESACARCGETSWQYESLSPSGKAATWRCGYCRKTTIVKSDDMKRRTAVVNRQPIPKEVQREVWQRDGGKCVVCGSQELLEFDHIIAVSQGGSNTARNIQLLCQNCNRKKSGKPPGEI